MMRRRMKRLRSRFWLNVEKEGREKEVFLKRELR